jgi:multidrug efflux system outer membrane protein
MMIRRCLSTATLLAALLAGCTVGPSAHRRTEPAVDASRADPKWITGADGDLRWWSQFHDPTLDDLMTQALAHNLDLASAAARVQSARALFQEQRLNQWPHVSTDGSYTRGREQVPGVTDSRVTVEYADLGFDATWELDLFGRVRHQVRAARAQAQASEADLAAARVTVAAEVARNYLSLRGSQEQEAIVRENVTTAEDTLRVTADRFEVGGVNQIDVDGARVQLNAERARLPDIATQEAQASARIAVLCGQRPGALDTRLRAPAQSLPPRQMPLAVGDLGQLLERRPDVQAAERRAAAATEATGSATADLLPRLQLTGFVGFLSGDVSRLFQNNSRAWAVSPTVTWPALDLGSAAARLRAQRAAEGEAVAQYQLSILVAIEDLQNALAAYQNHQAQLAVLAERAQAAMRQYDLARVLYDEGGIAYLRLLTAQRDQLDAQEALVVARTATNTDAVAIFKALGGAAAP